MSFSFRQHNIRNGRIKLFPKSSHQYSYTLPKRTGGINYTFPSMSMDATFTTSPAACAMRIKPPAASKMHHPCSHLHLHHHIVVGMSVAVAVSARGIVELVSHVARQDLTPFLIWMDVRTLRVMDIIVVFQRCLLHPDLRPSRREIPIRQSTLKSIGFIAFPALVSELAAIA